MSRHLALCFRGTGGVIGQDYVSRVCQGAQDLVEEVHPEFPATFGGLPVGAAGDISDPSMDRAVQTAYESALSIFRERRTANPDVKVIPIGYSAGAVAAAKFRAWLQEHYPENYLCSVSFGDPTRPSGGAYFGGTPAPGHGISSWRYGDVTDWRHCWLANPGDIYTAVPEGDTGLIMGDFYDILTHVQLSDPLGTFGAILQALPSLLTHVGIVGERREAVAPQVLTALVGAQQFLHQPPTADPLSGLLTAAMGGFPLGALNNPLALILSSVVGLLDGEPDDLAAAINAAILAMQFFAAGTAPHISYEHTEVWPGQTHLGLAIQHVRDWASRPAT